jgi:putative ABC transport system substrate-binding protein
MSSRRAFITLLGGAAAWPVVARAQLSEGARQIGVLMGLAEDDPDTKARLFGLRQSLEKLGWVEGRNLRIDYRFAPAGALTNAIVVHGRGCLSTCVGQQRHKNE